MGNVNWAPAPTAAEKLAAAQQAAIQRINAAYTDQVQPMIREYPLAEQQSWPQQDAEAAAFLAWHEGGQQGEPPATPVLTKILKGRNGNDGSETLYELCQRVRENAEMFIAAQELTGRRQRLVKKIQAAETIAEVQAVAWPAAV